MPSCEQSDSELIMFRERRTLSVDREVSRWMRASQIFKGRYRKVRPRLVPNQTYQFFRVFVYFFGRNSWLKRQFTNLHVILKLDGAVVDRCIGCTGIW